MKTLFFGRKGEKKSNQKEKIHDYERNAYRKVYEQSLCFVDILYVYGLTG